MIHLITGQPGAGKTLYALTYALALAKSGLKLGEATLQREVYYNGIKDLKLPWIPLEDATKWFGCPTGSIVVIDEAQRVFRVRGVGAVVPDYVSALETHRHSGLDLVVITQHPMLLDTNLRRLVGRHLHVVRAFGMQHATVHEWSELNAAPEKSREGSVRHEFKYPKEAFGWYQSAEVHTHKRRIPMRLFFLILFPVLLGGLVWIVVKHFAKLGDSAPAAKSVKGGTVDATGAREPPSKSGQVAAREYLASRVPVVPGLPHTAPAFHEVTTPKVAPSPAACVASADRCACFTAQATVLNIPVDMCRAIVAGGYFEEWREPERTAIGSREPRSRREVADSAQSVTHTPPAAVSILESPAPVVLSPRRLAPSTQGTPPPVTRPPAKPPASK